MPFDWRSLTNGDTLFGNAPGGGLLGDEPKVANRDGMMALAAQLLEGGGYSPQRTTFGQQIGRGLQVANAARAQSLQDQQKARLVNAQIAATQAKPTGPASVQEYEFAKANGFQGSFQEWVVAGGQSSRPSSVQEWEFYNSLPTPQKQQYLEMKRNPNFAVKDVNTVPTVIQPSVVAGTSTTPLSTQQSEAEAAAEKKRQEAAAAEIGKGQGSATIDLPRIETNTAQALDVINKLKAHPGLPYITGIASNAPIIPGTDQAAADALAQQIQGAVFLQAYESLRGAQGITDVEGKKAESAKARLQRAQSPEDYRAALDDLQDVLKSGLATVRKKAGGSAAAPKRVRVDAAGNVIGN